MIMDRLPFAARKRVSSFLRAVNPGFSSCHRCHVPWSSITLHSTTYSRWGDGVSGGQSGCFALCESCWRELGTAEARLPFYRQLFDEWGHDGAEKWDLIERAVYAEVKAA